MKKTVAVLLLLIATPIMMLGFTYTFILQSFKSGIDFFEQFHEYIDKGIN